MSRRRAQPRTEPQEHGGLRRRQIIQHVEQNLQMLVEILLVLSQRIDHHIQLFRIVLPRPLPRGGPGQIPVRRVDIPRQTRRVLAEHGARVDDLGVDPQQLAVRQHALLETGREEVDVVLHELVDGALGAGGVPARVQTRHEALPVGLDDLGGAEVEELLDEDEHAGAQRPGAAFPDFDRAVGAPVAPGRRFAVFDPGTRQERLEVAEGEEVAEEELVTGEGDSADDEAEGEGDGVVEDEGVEAGDLLVVGGIGLYRWVEEIVHAGVGTVDVEAGHVDDAHQPVGEGDLVHDDFDVFFEGVFGGDGARLANDDVEEGLEFAGVDEFRWFAELGTGELEKVGEEVGAIEEEVMFQASKSRREGMRG